MPTLHTATQTLARWALAAFMLTAGVGHFRSTDSFRAQVPPFLPYPELIIYVSGVFEIGIAFALVFAQRHRARVGWILAAFYVLIFPGNISQYITHTSAFGLDTDIARAIRLFFQPVLIAVALWSTGAWAEFQSKGQKKRPI